MLYSVKMRSAQGGPHEQGGRHISGAERILSEEKIEQAIVASCIGHKSISVEWRIL